VQLPNEEENLLFGPTARPLEPVHAGSLPEMGPGSLPVPRQVFDVLPVLNTIAASPDAPPQIVGLAALLNHILQGA
jgi:hypothetical protein